MKRIQSNILARNSKRFKIGIAEKQDRNVIYKLRHDIYAKELGQHRENESEMLSDSLDSFNTYITASENNQIVGFISITPPSWNHYSVDKYVRRDLFPFPFNDDVFEIRLLTVVNSYRLTQLAGVLMYAAFRWVEAQGGKKIVAIGRREVLDVYLKAGLKQLKHQIISGKVTFELLSGEVDELRNYLKTMAPLLTKLEQSVDWGLPISFGSPVHCYHGGAFFKAIGEEFDTLKRHKDVINADVLDAWFLPSPHVVESLREYLPSLLS